MDVKQHVSDGSDAPPAPRDAARERIVEHAVRAATARCWPASSAEVLLEGAARALGVAPLDGEAAEDAAEEVEQLLAAAGRGRPGSGVLGLPTTCRVRRSAEHYEVEFWPRASRREQHVLARPGHLAADDGDALCWALEEARRRGWQLRSLDLALAGGEP